MLEHVCETSCYTAWEVVFTSGFESELPGELESACYFVTILIEASHLRETDSLDPFGLGSESSLTRFEKGVLDVANVVIEGVSEPVEVLLTLDFVHSDEVGRVLAVSEELDSYAWSQYGSLGVSRLGDRHANKTTVGASEHTCVGVRSEVLPGHSANHALSMDSLVAASIPVAF